MRKKCLYIINSLFLINSAVAISIWVASLRTSQRKDEFVDWPMFWHAVPSLIFFAVALLTIFFIRKNKFRIASASLIVLFISAISFFLFETQNHYYQLGFTVQSRGNHYSVVSIGYRHVYFNWIWYSQKIYFSDLSSEQNPTWGFIDKSGNMVIVPQFESTKNFSEGLACVIIKGKYGYIDKTGNVIIQPVFDFAGNFHEDMAAVRTGEKWGYIDKTGKIIIEPEFNYADDFSENLALVRIPDDSWDGKHVFINTKGQVVIDKDFNNACSFSEGLAAVDVGTDLEHKWGFVDKSGNFVIKPQFSRVDYKFSEGYVSVEVDNKFTHIDKSGNLIVDPQFEKAYRFSDGLALIWEFDHRWGYRRQDKIYQIDPSGKRVDRPYFDKPICFHEGLAAVEIDGKYGYIDKNGEVVIQPKFTSAARFSEGLAAVRLNK